MIFAARFGKRENRPIHRPGPRWGLLFDPWPAGSFDLRAYRLACDLCAEMISPEAEQSSKMMDKYGSVCLASAVMGCNSFVVLFLPALIYYVVISVV